MIMSRLFRFYVDLIAANIPWIKRTAWWAVFWFAVGVIAFLLRPDTAPKFLQFLEKVFREILGDREPVLNLSTVLLIFKNNIEAALMVLFGGIVLGLVPLVSLALNFFITGYILALFSMRGSEGFGLFLGSVVAHGIVEIPLFILAAAFGLRLGYFWQIESEGSNWQKLLSCFKDNLKLVPALAVGFFLAALLEVFVSGRLIALLFPSS